MDQADSFLIIAKLFQFKVIKVYFKILEDAFCINARITPQIYVKQTHNTIYLKHNASLIKHLQ